MTFTHLQNSELSWYCVLTTQPFTLTQQPETWQTEQALRGM